MKRFNDNKKIGIIGIIGNLFLFVIKIIVGFISNSQSMIADSFNSAGDIFASLMTWIGNKISSVPNDEDHNFGHGKAEYLFSMFISISMMAVALKMLYDSFVSIIFNNKLVFSWNLIIVCIITILAKYFLYCYSKFLYKKNNNLLVKANMVDHRNDCVITLFTTIAILLTKINIFWFDGLVGIGISILIFIVGLGIFRESYNVLMDSSIDNESKKKILKIIKKEKSVKRIGSLYSIPIGSKYIIVITIFLDGSMSTTSSHKITDKLEKNILAKVNKVEQVVVHVEPFVCEK
ncbi:MAG: cation transporter [Bacilli bacterium]|nr:cation transporter [Bacilli bacterium]